MPSVAVLCQSEVRLELSPFILVYRGIVCFVWAMLMHLMACKWPYYSSQERKRFTWMCLIPTVFLCWPIGWIVRWWMLVTPLCFDNSRHSAFRPQDLLCWSLKHLPPTVLRGHCLLRLLTFVVMFRCRENWSRFYILTKICGCCLSIWKPAVGVCLKISAVEYC